MLGDGPRERERRHGPRPRLDQVDLAARASARADGRRGVDQVDEDGVDLIHAGVRLIRTDHVVQRAQVRAEAVLLDGGGVVRSPAADHCPGGGIVDRGISRIRDAEDRFARRWLVLRHAIELGGEQERFRHSVRRKAGIAALGSEPGPSAGVPPDEDVRDRAHQTSESRHKCHRHAEGGECRGDEYGEIDLRTVLGTPRGEHATDRQSGHGQVLAQRAAEVDRVAGEGHELRPAQPTLVTRQTVHVTVAWQARNQDVVAARMEQRAQVAELDRAAGNPVQENDRARGRVSVVEKD